MSRKWWGLVIAVFGACIMGVAIWLASKGLHIALVVGLVGAIPYLVGMHNMKEGAISEHESHERGDK